MFTCGPAFFVASAGGPLPPAPVTQTMDYVFHGTVFVVARDPSIDTSGLNQVLKAEPFFAQ